MLNTKVSFSDENLQAAFPLILHHSVASPQLLMQYTAETAFSREIFFLFRSQRTSVERVICCWLMLALYELCNCGQNENLFFTTKKKKREIKVFIFILPAAFITFVESRWCNCIFSWTCEASCFIFMKRSDQFNRQLLAN